MTNADAIRSMSDEQLAEFLLWVAFNFCFSSNEEQDMENMLKALREPYKKWLNADTDK